MNSLAPFKKALCSYELARHLYTAGVVDEGTVGWAGFHLQQCVELTLKGYLEYYGIQYPPKHTLSVAINITDNSRSTCVITDWLRQNSHMLTEWESKGRYDYDMMFEIEKIKEALKNVKIFLSLNGVMPVLLPEITEDIKTNILERIPSDYNIQSNLEWNVLYKLLYPTRQDRPIPFNMEDYFVAFKVTDKEAEIRRLKAVYNTNDMSIIKEKAQLLLESLN